MRTHTCNQLRPDHNGDTVTLIGWVNSARDHGGVIFIDLRDREGLTQCVFRPEQSADAAKLSHSLRAEDVIRVTGTVEPRPEIDGKSTVNADLPTGGIEVAASELKILNKAEVLPFQLEKELSNEDLRLSHRYLDLRRPRLARNLRTRHLVTKAARDFLDSEGFIEVETPILSKSTPEGARDFLVPSRMHPGSFYALPQAPQQYKQLLMVAGVEKYFQVARCFRDEDLRADRQPEFTQVDIEASFTDPDQIIGLIEGCLAADSDLPAGFARARAEIEAAGARSGALLSTRRSYPLALAYLVSSNHATLRDALLRLDHAGCAPLAHLPSEALVALCRLELEGNEKK